MRSNKCPFFHGRSSEAATPPSDRCTKRQARMVETVLEHVSVLLSFFFSSVRKNENNALVRKRTDRCKLYNVFRGRERSRNRVANAFNIGNKFTNKLDAREHLKGAFLLETGLALEMISDYSDYNLARAYQIDIKRQDSPLPSDSVKELEKIDVYAKLFNLPPSDQTKKS